MDEIDIRDFDDVPRDEMRGRIEDILLFIAGSLDAALSDEEKRDLVEMAKRMKVDD